jgi:hypothetical protein
MMKMMSMKTLSMKTPRMRIVAIPATMQIVSAITQIAVLFVITARFVAVTHVPIAATTDAGAADAVVNTAVAFVILAELV